MRNLCSSQKNIFGFKYRELVGDRVWETNDHVLRRRKVFGTQDRIGVIWDFQWAAERQRNFFSCAGQMQNGKPNFAPLLSSSHYGSLERSYGRFLPVNWNTWPRYINECSLRGRYLSSTSSFVWLHSFIIMFQHEKNEHMCNGRHCSGSATKFTSIFLNHFVGHRMRTKITKSKQVQSLPFIQCHSSIP